ncbi:DUF333 domain-containing protein [Arsenophonus sp. aPb]|uniref:putative hemolysin n=1 Tax=Arsenophonus sp. aPb TaxID=3041619 RepID=UPI0024689D60|nr:DUF333 domain-containing protein [Arsenophonus sp. aPb]WGL97967.1 DUF333 domain-containing protein [Arsenophonus sp. aPb]
MKKILLLLTYIYLVGCTNATESLSPTKTIGVANPASVYCIKKGGKINIVKTVKGEVGYCHLANGVSIEEWTLYHQDHQ